LHTIIEPSELQEDAKLVIDVMNEKEDVQLDYSEKAISWLDTYIDQHQHELNETDKTVLQEKFGAFVGETIRQNYGGEWIHTDNDEWMIAFNDEVQTAPFEMVSTTLETETSLTKLYKRIPELFDQNAINN
jgi:hypothetical protein